MLSVKDCADSFHPGRAPRLAKSAPGEECQGGGEEEMHRASRGPTREKQGEPGGEEEERQGGAQDRRTHGGHAITALSRRLEPPALVS